MLALLSLLIDILLSIGGVIPTKPGAKSTLLNACLEVGQAIQNLVSDLSFKLDDLTIEVNKLRESRDSWKAQYEVAVAKPSIPAGKRIVDDYFWRRYVNAVNSAYETGIQKHFEHDVVQAYATIREIDNHEKAGQRIEAIKLYRKTLDIGLKEAKDAIEDRANWLKLQNEIPF